MSGREILLEAEALTAHAARVRALGADAAEAVAEVRRTRADGASLGVLCVFLSPVLGALAAAGSRGCTAAVRSLESDADLAISAAVQLLNADLGAEEGMRQLGRLLDRHDAAGGGPR